MVGVRRQVIQQPELQSGQPYLPAVLPDNPLLAVRFYAGCAEGGRLPFVVGAELKATGELIGDTGISEVEGRPGEAEVGYCIGQKHRRKGYAAELLDGMTAYIAARFEISVIHGRVVNGNTASQKVLEKNAYQFLRTEFGAPDDPYGNGMLVYQKKL